MTLFEIYAQTKLRELETGYAAERYRLAMEVKVLRPRRRTLVALLAPALIALGSWLERLGKAMASSAPPELAMQPTGQQGKGQQE